VARLSGASRARAQRLIAAGQVMVDGAIHARPGEKLRGGESVVVMVPPPLPAGPLPQAIPLAIVYEDDHLLAIDKPTGMTVHPGPGHATSTLVNAVLAHCPELPGIGGVQRPGIVHRLDKDTSGLILVAKTDAAHRGLSNQLKERRIAKTYLALVEGVVAPPEALIDAPIGRDPNNRLRMTVIGHGGREAQTRYRVVEQLGDRCLVEARPITGRTHQIRVHLASVGHPVVGDPVYGRPSPLTGRLLLHAWRLELRHPVTDIPMLLEAPLPADFREALARLGRVPAP
jgi:23S rRNA pseudouridine1911/1915/1917 synthase